MPISSASRASALAERTERLERADAQVLVGDAPALTVLTRASRGERAGRVILGFGLSRSLAGVSAGLSSATRTFAPIAAATAAVCVSPKGFARLKIDLRRAAGEVLERLEPPQLHAARRRVEDARRLGEVLRALEVGLALDDDVLPIALGDRLARDHLLHLLRELDVLERDELDVEPPLRDELLDRGTDLRGDLFAVREQVVELRLADDVAEHDLRAIADGVLVVLHVERRALDVDDLEVDDGVDPRRDVVRGDDRLLRQIAVADARVDLHEPLHAGDDEVEPRLRRAR